MNNQTIESIEAFMSVVIEGCNLTRRGNDDFVIHWDGKGIIAALGVRGRYEANKLRILERFLSEFRGSILVGDEEPTSFGISGKWDRVLERQWRIPADVILTELDSYLARGQWMVYWMVPTAAKQAVDVTELLTNGFLNVDVGYMISAEVDNDPWHVVLNHEVNVGS